MPAPAPAPATPARPQQAPLATDYWRRQEQHLAQALGRLVAEHRRTGPAELARAEDARCLRDAKAAYDRMLADLSRDDRAIIERLMTVEMTMLMLAIAGAAGDLALAHLRREHAPSGTRVSLLSPR